MKKTTILSALLLLSLMFAGNVFAQTDITASAEVQSNLTVNEEQETNFGVIVQDFTAGNPSIDPSDGTTANIENATNVTVGMVSVSGTQDQTVDITVDTDFDLTESGGDVITFFPNYNWTYDNLSNGDSPSNPGTANTTSDFSMTLDGSTGDDGQNTILIGGTLTENKTGALNTGTYSGTGSITVSYQ